MTTISLIAALTYDRVIGKEGGLPWRISEELKYFKTITMGKWLILGRSTFASLGYKTLPGRKMIVLSKSLIIKDSDVLVANSVDAVLALLKTRLAAEQEIMVIGGGNVYQQFLPLATKMYLSWIKKDYAGDTFFPLYDQNAWQVTAEHEYAEFIAQILIKNQGEYSNDVFTGNSK